MQRIGLWIEEKLAPGGFLRAVESALQGNTYRMQVLRDLPTFNNVKI